MPPKRPVGGRRYSTFGRRVSKARSDLKLKAEQVADQVGVTKATVYSWEQGKTIPPRGRLATLADVLDLDVNELEDVIAGDRRNTHEQPTVHAQATSTPDQESGSNRLFLEVGGLRLDVRQSLPIYVQVTIGPLEPPKVPRPAS